MTHPPNLLLDFSRPTYGPDSLCNEFTVDVVHDIPLIPRRVADYRVSYPGDAMAIEQDWQEASRMMEENRGLNQALANDVKWCREVVNSLKGRTLAFTVDNLKLVKEGDLLEKELGDSDVLVAEVERMIERLEGRTMVVEGERQDVPI